MTDSLSPDHRAIDEAIGKVCADFVDDYWLARDTDGEFPEQFVAAIAAGGWLGIAMPEAHGGAGLGVTEAALMMRRIAQSGGGFAAASSVHINIFGPQPIVKFGTAEQQARMLPPLMRGDDRSCFGVTEPNAGLDTGAIETRARVGGGAGGLALALERELDEDGGALAERGHHVAVALLEHAEEDVRALVGADVRRAVGWQHGAAGSELREAGPGQQTDRRR